MRTSPRSTRPCCPPARKTPTPARPIDYEYHWRADQSLPQRDEVQALAEETNVEITSWAQQGAAVLGKDGTYSIETDTGFGTTYTTAYAKLLHGATFFSESAYNALTGQDVDIPAGACAQHSGRRGRQRLSFGRRRNPPDQHGDRRGAGRDPDRAAAGTPCCLAAMCWTI